MDHFIDTSIDPSDYDIDELREPPADDARGVPSKRGSGASLQADQYRELLMLQSADDGMEKPYLAALPATYPGELATFEWLEFLVETGGFKRTYDALRYYQSVGWITEAVERRLHEYLSGLPEPDTGDTRPFDQSDHLRSLIYVGRLASR